jgi:hypothetical protein
MTTTRQAPRRFKPLDFLDVDAELEPDEIDIRDNVRRFVGDRLLPEVGGWFERGEMPSRELGNSALNAAEGLLLRRWPKGVAA